MKKIIVAIILIVLAGCSHRKYNLIEGTVEVTDFLCKTEIPYLYYADDKIHIEIENFKKSTVDFQVQAFNLGLSVGRQERREEVVE